MSRKVSSVCNAHAVADEHVREVEQLETEAFVAAARASKGEQLLLPTPGPPMSKHFFETAWTDERDEETVERFLSVEFSCSSRGLPHGYFDPISGDGEAPSGPEIEIVAVEEKLEDGTWRPVDTELFLIVEGSQWFYEKMCDVVDDDDYCDHDGAYSR